jgi:choice-of-anchor A domain-containing protein
MSEQWRDQPATGQVASSGTVLTLKGSSSPVEIFTLTAAQAAASQRVSTTNVSSTAYLVINISADTARRVALGLDMSGLVAWKGRILINVFDAENLQFGTRTVFGNVLAPNACVCNGAGHLEGSIVARKWSGAMQIGFSPFTPRH